MRRVPLALGSLLLTATLALSACGSDAPSGSTETKVLSFTLSGGHTTPDGEVVKVDRGQPIEIKVTADAPGTIHVHSTPEHEFSFESGETTLETFTIDKSGAVPIELHDPELQVFRLEVQ